MKKEPAKNKENKAADVPHEVAFYGAKTIDGLEWRGKDRGPVKLRLITQAEAGAYVDLYTTSEDKALRDVILEPEGDWSFEELTMPSLTKLNEENLKLNFTEALAFLKAKALRAQETGAGSLELISMMAALSRKFAGDSPPKATSEKPS